MEDFLGGLRYTWLTMLEPPWRHSGDGYDRDVHWFYWIVAWTWTLAGLVFGALVAPPLMQVIGLAETSYQDWLVIAFAVLLGVVVQLLGFGLTRLYFAVTPPPYLWEHFPLLLTLLLILMFLVVPLLPLVGIGYGTYRYLTWVGAGQREVTVAFVGGLLIKTFAIPLIKAIVTGALFRWFMKWLRGGEDTKNA